MLLLVAMLRLLLRLLLSVAFGDPKQELNPMVAKAACGCVSAGFMSKGKSVGLVSLFEFFSAAYVFRWVFSFVVAW